MQNNNLIEQCTWFLSGFVDRVDIIDCNMKSFIKPAKAKNIELKPP